MNLIFYVKPAKIIFYLGLLAVVIVVGLWKEQSLRYYITSIAGLIAIFISKFLIIVTDENLEETLKEIKEGN